MRNSWSWRALTSVAIAAASTAWAQSPGGAGSPSAEGTHEATPKMQGNDTQSANPGDTGSGSAESGPSPRDQPAPGLRLDDRMNRLPAQRGDNGSNGAQGNDAQGNGMDNGSGNGTDNGANGPSSTDKVPQNPANPATPIFPANPHPPADPGQPGNPVTPATLHFA